MNQVNDFMKNAKGLAKNPLGIIALFISLIYGFACLVLSTSIKNLNQEERSPLIWFIILFPCIILIAFIYLVVKHHKKLYAPSDYKDESNFIKTIDESKQIIRLKEEIQQVKTEILDDVGENLPNEIAHVENENENLMKEYMWIENYAINRLNNEFKFDTIQRQSKVFTLDNTEIEFDAIATKKDDFYGVEIKYTKTNKLTNSFKNSIEQLIINYRHNKEVKGLGDNFHYLIVIVVDSDISKVVEQFMLELKKQLKFKYDYRIYTTTNISDYYNNAA